MEKLDKLGVFWLAGREEDVLSGRLTFDPEVQGTRLALVGIFEIFIHKNNANDDNIRIHGWINNDPVTLDRCFVTGSTHRSPGPYASAFYANELFIGEHLEGDKEFDTAIVSVEYLDVLLGNCGISEEATAEGCVIEIRAPKSHSAGFSRGAVSVGFSWKSSDSSLTEIVATSNPYFKIDYNARSSFGDIQNDIAALESLVSMCVDVPSAVDRVVLRRSDLFATMINGQQSAVLQPIEYRTPNVGYIPPENRKRLYQHDVLFTFEELGGVERVAAWLDQAAELRRPLGSLMSIMRAKQMFAENRFMNVTYSAEALHRILDSGGQRMEQESFDLLIDKYVEVTPAELHQWLRDRLRHSNEPSLTKRLSKMASYIGPMVKSMLGNRDRWAGTIAAVRNDTTHLGARDSGLDGGVLYYLTESVFAVARLYILLHIGVAEEVMRAKLNSQKTFRQRDRIVASIESARDYLRSNGMA